MFPFRWFFLVLLGGVLLGGCGGGYSGPDSHTSPGLGTLIVDVAGAGNNGTVFLERIGRPTRDGSAYFYNVAPGRYHVTASVPLGFSDSQNVSIVADKTRRISLSPTTVVPFPSPTPF